MKKNFNRILFTYVLITVAVLALPSCRSMTTFSTQTTSLSPTTETAELQPVGVVSVLGPFPPFNPGGPVVEITLRNAADMPLVSLTAVFTNLGISDFNFVFSVSASNPLLSGASISDKLTLIGGGFSSNELYPLKISGTWQNGSTFSYIEQVKIVQP